MNKKQMSEQDIRTKYITPAILAAGWDYSTQKNCEAWRAKTRRLYFVLETKDPIGNRGGKRQ